MTRRFRPCRPTRSPPVVASSSPPPASPPLRDGSPADDVKPVPTPVPVPAAASHLRRPRRAGLGGAPDRHRRPEEGRPRRHRRQGHPGGRRSSSPASAAARSALLPGTYRLRNAVYLQSNVRLLGSGADTILIKEPSRTTQARRGLRLVRPGDHPGRRHGLRGRRRRLPARPQPAHGGADRHQADAGGPLGQPLQARPALRENLWLMGEATASTLFPILTGEHVADVAIENLSLDGNKANNDNLDGNYAGCIFLQDCNRVHIRKRDRPQLQRRRHQLADLPRRPVEDCHSHDHAGLGLHPGSGSQRPIIRGNRLERNDIGLFFCWGVRGGLAEKNRIAGNRRRHLDRPPRHRQPHPRQRHPRQRQGRRPVPPRARQGVRPAPQPAGEQPHRRQRPRGRRRHRHPGRGRGGDARRQHAAREPRAGRPVGVRIGAKVGKVEMKDNRVTGFAATVEDLRVKKVP